MSVHTCPRAHRAFRRAAATVMVAMATAAPLSCSSASTPSDAATQAEKPATTSTASSDATTTVVPTAAPERLIIPEPGLDLPVLPLEPEEGAIDPPTMEEAYWVEPYGAPGTDADNTVYIAGHTWGEDHAAFNDLLDATGQGSALVPGDEITVVTANGRLTYEVQGSQGYHQSELADAKEVWEIVPGRLVLITCQQRNDGQPPTDNLVVTAELARSVVP